MKTLLLITFVLCYTGFVFGQINSLESFNTLCDSNELAFLPPSGYEIIDVKENGDLSYDFALLREDSTMEIRYTVWSLKTAVKQYEASLTDSNSMMIPPNNIYKGRIQANALNMNGGQPFDIGPFPPDAVFREFKADAGGSCFLLFSCQFGEGYKYGQFMYLHKDNVADVIITFMSNDMKKHSDLMMEGFHSLTFK